MDTTKVILILDVSRQPYISIARHYGGIKFQGEEYCYIDEHDALLKQKYMSKYKKHIKNSGTWEDFVELIRNIKQ
jgi:hypothetical protein